MTPDMILARHALVFDLDGTLVDTAPDLCATLNWVLAREGRPPVALTEMRRMIGEGARRMIERGFEVSGPVPPEADMKRLFANYIDHYRAHICVDSRLFPGVRETLEALAANGAVLGVCTNKSTDLSLSLLEKLEIDGLFRAIVGPDAVSAKKPDPAHVLETIEALGATADEAVMIGDSETDVKAAKAAGVPVVAVSFGYAGSDPAELGADALLDDFADLPGVLAALS